MSDEMISKIRSLSAMLTSHVDDRLARGDAKVRSLNLNFTFWSGSLEESEYLDEDDDHVIDSWNIGLLDGGLAVRRSRYYPHEDRTIDLGLSIPIANAPFNVRILVAQHLDVFLAELASELASAVGCFAEVKESPLAASPGSSGQ